jgi:hypothetical protein
MNLFCRGAKAGEIGQHQAQALIFVLSDANVARLDVTMGDAVAIEIVERFEQVLA